MQNYEIKTQSLNQKKSTNHYDMQVNYSYSNGINNKRKIKESKEDSKEGKENCKEETNNKEGKKTISSKDFKEDSNTGKKDSKEGKERWKEDSKEGKESAIERNGASYRYDATTLSKYAKATS